MVGTSPRLLQVLLPGTVSDTVTRRAAAQRTQLEDKVIFAEKYEWFQVVSPVQGTERLYLLRLEGLHPAFQAACC